MSLSDPNIEHSMGHAPVGFLVLAAGHSRRFGRCKLSAKFKSGDGEDNAGELGSTVLGAVLGRIAPLTAPVCVITSKDKTSVIDIATQHRVETRQMPASSAGMGQSIAFGVSATQNWRGWIVCLGDMPWVTTETYAKVLALANGGAKQVAPTVEGRRGHPVYFAHCYGESLKRLSEDVGAASVIDPEVLIQIPIENKSVLNDVDRPDDLA